MSVVERASSVVTASEVADGAVPRATITGRDSLRLLRGVYATEGFVRDVDGWIAAYARRLPEGYVLGGWAAARLHEIAARKPGDELVVFDGVLPASDRADRVRQPVLICAPRRRRLRRIPGARLFRSDLEPDETHLIDGVAVTSATRTAFDLARLWPTEPAVVALDRLRALRLVDADELAALIRARPRWRGRSAAQTALELSDHGSESPRETLLRLLWEATGLERPLCNPVVRDARGRFVARVDLMDDRVGLVAEYDGADHASATRRRSDAARQEALEAVGLVVVRANEPDLATADGRRAWTARLRSAHRRASRLQRPRLWSLDPR